MFSPGVPDVAAHSLGRYWARICATGCTRLVASRSCLSQQRFELGEDLLDRIEVRRVFRQEDEARPNIADRLSHRLSLVGVEIVEDHDVARLEGRDEELFDIGMEALAIDGPLEHAGRFDAVAAQRGEEGRGLPFALRDLIDEAFTARGPAESRVMWFW